MAQQFQVLRCCFCQRFQIQQVKKSKKWNCKICDEKQSIIKLFGQGSASDCRRHVQKLNFLQGEREQAATNGLWHIEESIERGEENTCVRFKENLDWQEEKVDSGSRWTKYLDERCGDTEEEDMPLHTDRQTFSFKKDLVKDLRKQKMTCLHYVDAQRPEEKGHHGFAKEVRSLERTFEDATVERMGAHAMEELLVNGKNKNPGSMQKRFLSETRNDMIATQKKQRLVIQQTLPTATRDVMAASSTLISTTCCYAPKQNVCTLSDSMQQASNIKHSTVISIPTGRNSHSPVSVSAQSRLSNRLSEEPFCFPSANSLSQGKGLGRSLFSTGEDFDDHL